MHKATAPVDLDRSRGIRFSRTNVRFPRPSVIITMKLGLLALLTLLTNLVQGANTATPIADLNIKEGFAVELLYSVSKEDQGSWVSICTDPKGRLIVSDQYGSLYRLTPPAAGQALETSADTSAIVAKKQALRDAPAASGIATAANTVELKAQWDTTNLGTSPYS